MRRSIPPAKRLLPSDRIAQTCEDGIAEREEARHDHILELRAHLGLGRSLADPVKIISDPAAQVNAITKRYRVSRTTLFKRVGVVSAPKAAFV